jgi:hypothetical protein
MRKLRERVLVASIRERGFGEGVALDAGSPSRRGRLNEAF